MVDKSKGIQLDRGTFQSVDLRANIHCIWIDTKPLNILRGS